MHDDQNIHLILPKLVEKPNSIHLIKPIFPIVKLEEKVHLLKIINPIEKVFHSCKESLVVISCYNKLAIIKNE